MTFLMTLLLDLIEWGLSKGFALFAKDLEQKEQVHQDTVKTEDAAKVLVEEKAQATTKQESKDAGSKFLNS